MSSVYGMILAHREAELQGILAMGGRARPSSEPRFETFASLEPNGAAKAEHTGPAVHGQAAWGPGWRLEERVLLWDGEIYNQAQLRRSLGLPPHTAEPELVLRGWEQEGIEFLNRINGPFALALMDLEAGRWLLARGRQGLRPLFWYESAGGIAFARDIPTLLRCPCVGREPNWESVPEYLVFDHVAGGETLYRNVRELLPGQILSGSFSRAGTTLAASERPFLPASWSPRESDLVARTEVLLQAAAARLRALESGGDTALFLSGGVDSSLLALALKDRNPLSLTVTCEGYRHDDSPYARLVRDTLDLPGAEIPLNPETFAEGWWETIQALNAPLTSTNQVPWWLLCKESKARALSVAFSGEGADGWFVGGLYDEERDAMARLGAKDRDEVARRIIFCRTHVLNQPDLVERITAVPLAIHGRRAIWEDVREAGNGAPFDELAVLYHVRTAGNRLLTRADLVAAYHGIRLRLPYLEEHWLRWVRSLPYSLRNGEGIRKQPLKALCALHWGEAFSHRRKIGFPFPIRSWIRQGPTTLLRDWLGMLTDDLALSRGIYRTEALRQEIRCRVEGLRPNDWLLWSLINLELWLRHLEGRSSGA